MNQIEARAVLDAARARRNSQTKDDTMNDITLSHHRPLNEITADELLYSIRHRWADAYACRVELRRIGWTDAQIDEFSA